MNVESEYTDAELGVDVEWLERLRTSYRSYPPFAPRPIVTQSRLPRWASARRGPLLIGLAAAAVAAVVTVAIASESGKHSTGLQTAQDPSSVGQRSTAPTGRGLSASLYRVLDADPSVGSYMLAVDPAAKTVKFWEFPGGPTDAAARLRRLSEQAGYSFSTSPMTRSWPQKSQAQMASAADAIRAALRTGPSQLATLKLETPLQTAVVWTTNASAVQDRLAQIAAAHHVHVEVYNAPMSETVAKAFGVQLRTKNTTWQSQGFKVSGAYATGSGLVVVVTGNLKAAQAELASYSNIFAVVLDDGMPLSGSGS